jgi:16S rRNA (guanine966-N2)-methyltransferase
VFCDPPYGKGLAEKALMSARDGGWLQPNALIVVEERADIAQVMPDFIRVIEERAYGESKLVFGEMSAGKSGAPQD